ncbi:ABC transporter ATP-binding protein [bacterium]|nr:ABC transporter ATP-binding protein [bacterium]
MSDSKPLLDIRNLTKVYGTRMPLFSTAQRSTVVANVSIRIYEDECLALIGESGSGKSTLARCILRLIKADFGQVFYKDQDLLSLPARSFRCYRPQFQMIFQDPSQALNPRLTVRSALMEPLKLWSRHGEYELSDRITDLLRSVGLDPNIQTRFPSELSGGQRQRVAIARSLTTNPCFLIADEPTSSLDASHKKKIVELLQDLQHRLGLTLLLISHDMALVANTSDRIAVMYRGILIEVGRTTELLQSPKHPYTRSLIDAADGQSAPEDSTTEVTTVTKQTISGCKFSDYCKWSQAVCRAEEPILRQISEDHEVACHFADMSPWNHQFCTKS